MKLVMVKYNAGNTASVQNALQRMGFSALLTNNKQEIAAADKVIFPGVGHAGAAMLSLKQSGLDEVIKALTQPVLGICVGMQLLAQHSTEGDTTCLGIIQASVKKFEPTAANLKVPQMGWNKIYNLESPLFEGVAEGSHIYNVHSYYMESSVHNIATCNYGLAYAAAVQKNNFYGVQFHTEKSAATGDRILSNFIRNIS